MTSSNWFAVLSGLVDSAWGIHASFKVTFFISESCFQQMIRLSLFLSGRCWRGEALGLVHSCYSYSFSAVALRFSFFRKELFIPFPTQCSTFIHRIICVICFTPLLLKLTNVIQRAVTRPNEIRLFHNFDATLG